MQRVASGAAVANCLHAAAPVQTALFDLVRRLTCSQTHALHTTAAQLKKRQTPSIDDSDDPPLDETTAEVDPPEFDVSDAESMSDSEVSTSAAARYSRAAAAAEDAAQQQKHQGLDDLELNIILKYNAQFMMDPDRSYAIGQRNAYEKRIRLELRKALAAQRLQLRDAAAAATADGRRQASMMQQMNSRLADMQQYMNHPL